MTSKTPVKMIVTDLDNTLLTDDKKISTYTFDIINACRNRGIKFIPATARPLRKLYGMEIITQFPYDALITCNGSRIYLDDEVLYHKGMNKQELDAFLPILLKHYGDTRISIEINNIIHVNHNVLEVDPSETQYQISDLLNLPDDTVDRIIIDLPDKTKLANVRAILPDYLYAQAVSDSPICRILHKSVAKSYAIEHIANLWDIQPEEIICFGDDENDLEMFDFCGQAIAMDNAIPEIKAVATGHTTHNNADGVAQWLEKYVLS